MKQVLNHPLKNPLRNSLGSGFSLVEVLVALAVFSVTSVGLYLTMQSVVKTTIRAMERDIESAYVNMQIAEINPHNPDIEDIGSGGYDVVTKTLMTLPNSKQVYYTRIVDSTDTEADIKEINVYLYRKSSSTDPYRHFRREISPFQVGMNLGENTAYYVDRNGWVWAPGNFQHASHTTINTLDKCRNGYVGAAPTNYSTVSAISYTEDDTLFQKGVTASTLTYRFLASADRTYTVKLGFSEWSGSIGAGDRAMDIAINGSNVDTIDPFDETGAVDRALIKTYTATPTTDGNGVSVIEVALTQGTGATANPGMAFVSLERQSL